MKIKENREMISQMFAEIHFFFSPEETECMHPSYIYHMQLKRCQNKRTILEEKEVRQRKIMETTKKAKKSIYSIKANEEYKCFL